MVRGLRAKPHHYPARNEARKAGTISGHLAAVAALEDENKELIKALYGLGDILRDMNKLERITGARLDALERIINERTADS